MIRYTLFIAAVLGSAGYAIAAITPGVATSLDPRTTTVIEKNMAYPVLGELVFDACAAEDCSEE
jgi:hypothetical protein